MTDLLPTPTVSVFDQLPDDFDQWCAYGAQLQAADTAVNWAIGDWVLFGETHWPDRYLEAAAATGLAQKTIANAVTVASRIPPERRRADVPWATHREIVALPPADQDRYLAMAAREGLSSRALKAVVDQEQADRATAEDARDRPSPRAGSGAAPSEPLKPDHVQMPEDDNSVRGGRNTEQPAPSPVATLVEVPFGDHRIVIDAAWKDWLDTTLDQVLAVLPDRATAAGCPKIEVR